MKKLIIAGLVALAFQAGAQDENSDSNATIEGMDEAEALRILEDLEGLQSELEQVNQLGKVVPRKYAKLRFLDRLNAEVNEIGLGQGQTVDEAYISITLKACFVPASKSLQDAAAYLVIKDVRETVPVFDGWMIASSPALSAMDHPRYDVWVDSCSNDRPAVMVDDSIKAPPVRP